MNRGLYIQGVGGYILAVICANGLIFEDNMINYAGGFIP